MIQTAEQIIETVRALPLSEKEKFFDLAEAEKQKVLSEKEVRNSDLRNEREKFRLAMNWLDENRQKYLGQWVCLDGDKLISSGDDGVKVYNEAIAKGIEIPFMEFVKVEETAYLGGWEACL